jgi:hypothetical protein
MNTKIWLTVAAGALLMTASTVAQAQPVDEAQALANGSTATPHYGAWGLEGGRGDQDPRRSVPLGRVFDPGGTFRKPGEADRGAGGDDGAARADDLRR